MKFLKNMTNKKILNIFTLCILIIIPIMQMLAFYLQSNGVITHYNSINSAIVLWFSLPFFIYIYVKDIFDKKRKLDIYDYILYVLIVVGTLISILAIYPKISLFGVEERRSGFLTLLTYYLLIVNWKVNGTDEDIKKYIKIFIIIGIINSIYALLQIYSNFNFILRFQLNTHMATGFCGNPNFFGSLITMLLGIQSCKFLMSKKNHKIDIFILLLFLVSLVNCQSTGPALAYFITVIVTTILLKIKKRLFIRKIIILLFLILFTFLSVYKLNSITKKSKCELCDIKQTVNTGGTYRTKIWKETMNIVIKKPIFGVGYDNLEFAYPNPPLATHFYFTNKQLIAKEGTIEIVDNSHNEYLHTLVTSGLIGLIPNLILLLYTFIHGLKSNNKLVLMLLGGFVAYSIQAFANISVIEVAPIYYIIIGLILSEKLNKDKSLT